MREAVLRTVASESTLRVIFAAAVGVAALGLANQVSLHPTIALTGLLAVAGVAAAAFHLLAAVGVLAASFYFEQYLTGDGDFLTPAKAVGALALVAWLVAWLTRRRQLIGNAQLWVVVGLAVWMLPSMALAHDQGRALEVGSRYFMFFVLFFLVLQAVGSDRSRIEALLDVVLVAAAVAALLGLVEFLGGRADRARGPVEDPNDFGFLLASTVPLMVFRLARPRSPVHRSFVAACLLVTSAAVLATFSRGALLGLAAAGVWAVATRRLSAVVAMAFVAGLVVVGLVGVMMEPQVIDAAFARKRHIAGSNVQSRLVTWEVALQQAATAPVTGVGPGNYESRYPEFEPVPVGLPRPPTTHNAYLHVVAELGVPGLVLFLTFLVLSWRSLRRRTGDDRDQDALQAALGAGFLVAVVGAFFLTEQFYPPLWFLSALAGGGRAPAVRLEEVEA